jgi:hypothetical protein
LVGCWRQIDSNLEPGGVTLAFYDAGKLTYTIHGEQKDEIIELTYRVSGNTLVTDQPSHPRVERTTFTFLPEGLLELQHGEEKTLFERIDD